MLIVRIKVPKFRKYRVKMKIKSYIIIFLSLISLYARAQYDREAFMNRGKQALSDGKFATAMENFNILEKLDSTDYLVYFYKGIAKYNLGDVRGANSDFNKAIRLNPVFTSAYHYRGIVMSRFGEYDAALEDIETAIKLRPEYEGLYFSRAVNYFLSRRFEDAIKDFNFYIKKQPKDPSAFLNRGTCHLFDGDTLKALKDYDRAIKLDRFEPEGFIRRGRLYASKKEFEKGISDMQRAIEIDSTATFAYFNRALMYYELKDYNKTMSDLNKVVKLDPANSLALYNRSLIYAMLGDYESALKDMDKVVEINPKNVLAYFNRASFFVQMQQWENALEDYTKSIELFPDFAKAYKNRSFVELKLGMNREAKKDYASAVKKVEEYKHKKTNSGFADTLSSYNSLLSLDAEFAKKEFNNELLQHRDIDIRLKPLFRFVPSDVKDLSSDRLSDKYSDATLTKFICDLHLPVSLAPAEKQVENFRPEGGTSLDLFLSALAKISDKQFASALSCYDEIIKRNEPDKSKAVYKAYFLLNRAVLKSDMIDFITSVEDNVQVLTVDEKNSYRARVRDKSYKNYDYTSVIDDLSEASKIAKDFPYTYYNMGNVSCMSSKYVDAVNNYTKAINLYPKMGEAYFNRGLVLIYLKDKEKGCFDLSVAGELGIKDAYAVINKFCKESNER